jgi:hypothetical protein
VTTYRSRENLIRTNNQYLQGAQKSKHLKIQQLNEEMTHELNRKFSKEKVQMVNKYMKKCSTFLTIK